jgi:beta-glucosidase
MQVQVRNAVAVALAGFVLSACSLLRGEQPPAAESTTTPLTAEPNVIHPDLWPKGQSGVARDPAIETKVAALLAQMTTEEKVAQTIQADVASVTPADVAKYRLGSILNGGNSGPYGNDRALAPEWLKEADEFYAASANAPSGHVGIPVIWGSDSVHGNSNIIGATIFPHNVGLGATRDPDLLREIGKVTAIETRVVGADWTFAPTIAVVRDDRWGRTYEGYSEDPSIVHDFAGAMVEGIQGKPGDPDFLRDGHIIATAKHFLGDGGTDKGHDQGDNLYSEKDLRDIFSPGYQSAIAAGVQTVMASYSSWHGQKMHGNKALLSDVLVGRFGLDGFVVSDWNAHGQLAGCTNTSCAAAYLAGVDMIMAPDGWRGLYENTVKQVQSGEIPMARLDEAVSRILRVKLRAGVMDEGKPSARPYGGKWDELGSPEHRAVARRAVRESLVLLKNDGGVLPLKPSLHVLVAGDGANDMGKQTGGWTISWQGTGNSRADFPNGQTIFEGIAEKVKAAGGTAAYSADGTFRHKPDAAIVVFGENPYAEFAGDRDNLAFEPGDSRDLHLLQKLHVQGIPVIGVFLSGRPMYVSREINASDAFVAAWLPGSEGGGIADLLFRNADGSIAYDFRGKLSYSWPRGPMQTPLNVPGHFDADAPYDPLFAFGYGLDYAHPQAVGPLPEVPAGELAVTNVDTYLQAGHPAAPWSLSLVTADGTPSPADSAVAATPDGALKITHIDHKAQEDTVVAKWKGAASLAISGGAVDLSRQTNGDMALRLDLRAASAPTGPVLLAMGCGPACQGTVDVTQELRAIGGKGWTSVAVRLSCFKTKGADMSKIATPFLLTSTAPFALDIGSVKLAPGEGPPTCPAGPQS